MGPQISNRIKDSSPRAANELGFGVRADLKMQSAQRAPPRVERDGALHEIRFKAHMGKFLRAKAAQEMAAIIRRPQRLDKP
jgi:hypothetical protein